MSVKRRGTVKLGQPENIGIIVYYSGFMAINHGNIMDAHGYTMGI